MSTDKERLLETLLRLQVHAMGLKGAPEYKADLQKAAEALGIGNDAVCDLVREVKRTSLLDPWINLPLRVEMAVGIIRILQALETGDSRTSQNRADAIWSTFSPEVSKHLRVLAENAATRITPHERDSLANGDYATAWLKVNDYFWNCRLPTVALDETVSSAIKRRLNDLCKAA